MKAVSPGVAGRLRTAAITSFRPAATAVVKAFRRGGIVSENVALSTRAPGTSCPSRSNRTAPSGRFE